jgi:chromosome segregation ATPase
VTNSDEDSGTGDAAQSLEELQQRYHELHQRKIRAETNRENAEKRLAELQAEAREKFGTDNVEELEKKLAELEAENEKKRAEYQATLEKIEGDLASVEADIGEEEGSS